MQLSVITPTADIINDLSQLDIIGQKDSQLIYGETFHVEKPHGAFVYGHSIIDGYKGYVERARLASNIPTPTHYVTNLASHLYPHASFKSRPLTPLSFMSRLNLTNKSDNGFVQTHDGLWIFENHLTPIKTALPHKNLSEIAKLYLGTPYYFGGRASFGIDCAGLVQQTMVAAGYDCPPRDSIDQQGAFGTKISRNEIAQNDIVFFKGHVGIMMDKENILNATARHMTTLIEPLIDVEQAYAGGITHIARL